MSTVNSQCKMKQQRVNWWERRNNLEKILIVIIAFLLCFVFAIFIVLLLHFNHAFEYDTDVVTPRFASQNSEYEKFKETSSCTTPSCIKTAAKIMNLVNTSANPCVNFYDFACGVSRKKWREADTFSDVSTLEIVIENRIKNLIIEPVNEQLPRPLQLQRKFYESCMNTTAIDENQHDALLDLIGKVGGWPVRQGRFWYSENFNWIMFMVKCRKLGIDFNTFFLNITTRQVSINGTERIILMIKPPTRETVPPELQKEYLDLMTNISMELGALSEKYASTESERVLEFEDYLKKASYDEEENILPVEVLQIMFPITSWSNFLTNITSTPIKNDSLIDFRANVYLIHLSSLLEKTVKRIQANYVIWKIVENYRNYLSEPLQHKFHMFLMKINPTKVLNDRKSFCLEKAKYYFPSVAEATYVRSYVQNNTRTHINEIIENVRQQMQSEILENNELDENSKNMSLTKLNKVYNQMKIYERVFVQNFDKLVDFEHFNFDSDNVIDMDSQLNARRIEANFKNVNRNVNETDEDNIAKFSKLNICPADKRSYKNLVLFTILLNEIMDNFKSPHYVNYAALGTVITKEFNHFILLKSQAAYLAYKAYRGWVRQNPPEKNLPGLPYSKDQIFWITFGISKCYQLEQDDYHPPSASIITDTQNSRQFAAAFACPATP